MSSNVVVLGAGPAGLATGLALARAGYKVDVFEQAPGVGGLARTISRGRFRFDIGGHRWFTKKDNLNEFLIDLLGDELLLVNRISRIYFDGKYVHYPLRTGNVLSQVGVGTSVRAFGDFVASQVNRRVTQQSIDTMEDAFVAQFGRTLYELFFRRYSEKVWGRSCTDLSGDWVAQRSNGLSLFTAVRNAVKPSEEQVQSLVERFMYPSAGYGRISERMAEELEGAGGRVHLGWRVVGANHELGHITQITLSDGHHDRLVGADWFVSSIPMTELVQILRPAVDREVLEASESLSYRGVITIHLLLDRPAVSQDTWVYVHDPRVSFARLHEPRNWSPAMAPEGQTSLVLEIFCDEGDLTWRRSDQELCDLAIHDLERYLGFIERRDVLDAFAVRSRDAYPRYSLGYSDAVGLVKQQLQTLSNLAIVGRGGTFRYNNTDHAIETGLLAAAHILGDRSAPPIESVNVEQEYLEVRRAVAGSRR